MRRIPTPPVSQAILFRVRLVLLVVVLFAALASFSNGVGESKAAAIPTTTGRPTTTAPPTTVTAPTTTAPTAVAVAATSTADPPAPGPQVLAAGPDYELTSGPSGAGCTPGNTTKLPSGWWAGEVTATHGNSLDLNLVCFYVGEAANEAMERAGLGEEAMGMDTYMVDKN